MKSKLEHEAATRIQKVARKYATKLAQERAQNKGSKGTGKNKKNIKRKQTASHGKHGQAGIARAAAMGMSM